MYTTNIIEGLNRQYRKVTKTKSVFPSDAALEKIVPCHCVDICIIARISRFYSRGQVWAAPTKKAINTMSYLSYKKFKVNVIETQ